MNEYSYKELEEAAIEHRCDDKARETAAALAKWFEMYGRCYWNGEAFFIDEQYDLKLVYDGADADWKAVENGEIDVDEIPHHWEVK